MYLAEGYDKPWRAPGQVFRALGSFAHPIPLATFLITSLVLALWATQIPVRRYLNILRLLILAVIAMGAVITFTRSAWLAFIVATVGAFAYPRASGANRLRIIALVLSIVVLVAVTPLGGNVLERIQNVEGTSSLEQRMGSLQAVPQLLSRDPASVLLGGGANAREDLFARNVFQQTDIGLEVIDNQYVSILTEAGLLGLSMFVAILWSALSTARERALTASDTGTDKRMIIGIGIAFISLLVSIFFYEGLHWPPIAILFWSMLGFLARRDEITSSRYPAASRAVPPFRTSPRQMERV
jgi:O-antigen ligase